MDRVTRERRDALLADVATRPGARLELAELYRALGHVDQAGRWGVSTEGWARNRERDAYASMLSRREPDTERMLRRLSGLGASEELTGDARAVIDAADDHMGRPRAATAGLARVESASAWASGISVALGLALAVLVVTGVFVAAVSGASDVREPARLGSGSTAAVFALAAALRIPASAIRGQWTAILVLVPLAAILTWLAVLGIAGQA